MSNFAIPRFSTVLDRLDFKESFDVTPARISSPCHLTHESPEIQVTIPSRASKAFYLFFSSQIRTLDLRQKKKNEIKKKRK